MTTSAVVPPIPVTASQFATKMAFYVGGPLRAVRDAALSVGIPAETTASTVTTRDWVPQYGDVLDVADATDFTSTGAARLVDTFGNSYWFTYEASSATTLSGMTPVFAHRSPYTAETGRSYFPTGTVVSQWYDISDFVTSWRRRNVAGVAESYWTMELSGVGWNSLQIFPDAAVLAVATHYDDILGWHDPTVWFTGFLDEPRVKGDPTRNEWTCSAQGRRKYLKLQRNTPGQYGGELVEGTWTGSDPLLDLAAEPMEGQTPSDFALANISDEDEGTVYIAKDFPSVSTMIGGPTGVQQANAGNPVVTMFPNSGQGLRVTQCYFNPVPGAAHTAQSQKWLVLYNNTQTDVPSTPGPPIDILRWGIIDVTQYHLLLQNRPGSRCGSTARPTVIYLGTKGGGPGPAVNIAAHCGAVICYDEAVFRSQFSIPAGWAVIEIKQCSGDIFGTDLNVGGRGVGLSWDPDPDGCWVALRGGGRPGNNQDDGRYSARVQTDTGTTEIVLWDTDAGTLATWPNSGYVRGETSNRLVSYDAIDTANLKLTGVRRIRPGTAAEGTLIDNPLNDGSGERVNVWHDAGYWWDFVAIGPDIVTSVPSDFPVKRAVRTLGEGGSADDDGAFHNQQAQEQNMPGDLVWGLWDNGGAVPIDWDDGVGNTLDFVPPQSWGAFPTARKHAPACPQLQAIRRKGVMGGGPLREKASAPQWQSHDSNSAADWEVQTGPRIGNVDALVAFTWLKFQATEHAAAVVISDDSDVNDANGTLTVDTNQAREYPTSSPPNAKAWYMRALIAGGGYVDFTYTNRDASTFSGVVKIVGAGTEIPADSTLVTVINTKAAWNANGADTYIQKNLPIGTGISLRRWLALRTATVLAVESSNTVIRVRPGQADGFPASGTLILQPSEATTSGGITVVSASFNPDTFKATYTGRTDSTFTGVSFLGSIAQPGWIVQPWGGQLSYPADFDILLSREDTPTDPLLFIDNNPSWDVAYKSAFGNQVSGSVLPAGVMEQFFPFGGASGANPFFQWMFIKVHRMSDNGRFKANTVRVHKYPTRGQSSASDRSALSDWQMRYTTAELAHDILLDAGVPAALLWFSGGEQLRTFRLSEGNIWDSARGLAEMSSCVLSETSDGRLLFRRDPQASGAPFAKNGKLVIDEEAVWGDITATAQPRNAVAQIRLEARNPVQDQFITVLSPSRANPYGIVKTVSGLITPNQEAAEMRARLLMRAANGGWVLQVPSSIAATTLEVHDVVRFIDDVDVASRFFAQEMRVTSFEESGHDDRNRVSLELAEWITT